MIIIFFLWKKREGKGADYGVDSPLVPLGVIPWTVETFFTTLLCVVEIWKWDDRSDAIKWGLMGCYGPYLVICMFSSLSFLGGHFAYVSEN